MKKKSKTKNIKITHHLKPRDGIDMGYALQGNAVRNTYWEMFGSWPSDISWNIMNAAKPGEIVAWAQEDGGFHLVSLQIPKPVVDLELNYGKSFNDIHREIGSILKSRESGLILFHGISGSGKSTYIYHLIHAFPQKMIFIPNNVVAS